MIKMPRNHLADETLARIMLASKRIRRDASPPALEPEDSELVDLPPELMPRTPLRSDPERTDQQAADAIPADAADAAPPLDQSGLDTGAVLHGADSFDAMLM